MDEAEAWPPDAERVFRAVISYARGPHDRRALELSDRLNDEGVDCEIDQYNDAPPQGWPTWMLDVMVDRVVLVVCTELYARRLLSKPTGSEGKGVPWEGRILKQRIYDEGGRNEGIVPVIFDPADKQYIPMFLRDVTYYDLSTETGYERLYRRLTKQPLHIKPPLGKVQILPAAQSNEPPTPAGAVRHTNLDVQRLGFGRLANALTFSNIGANARPRHDTPTIEYFEPLDEQKIVDFVRSLRGWERLSAKYMQVPEGIIISDHAEYGVAEFGRSTNGVYIRFDGSVTLRSGIVGAHFLYDVERVLATTYAICRFLHQKMQTYPVYNVAFGYNLYEAPWPHDISQSPYDASYELDVRREFTAAATSVVMGWSRSAWPIQLTTEEVRSELSAHWAAEFSQPMHRALGSSPAGG